MNGVHDALALQDPSTGGGDEVERAALAALTRDLFVGDAALSSNMPGNGNGAGNGNGNGNGAGNGNGIDFTGGKKI